MRQRFLSRDELKLVIAGLALLAADPASVHASTSMLREIGTPDDLATKSAALAFDMANKAIVVMDSPCPT